MRFGERLKELRLKNEYTQLQLANMLGVSKSNISKYEAGSVEPNLDIIAKAAKLLCVSTDYLLGISDNQSTAETRVDVSPHILSNRLNTLLHEDSLIDISGYAQMGHMNASILQKYTNGELLPSVYDFCKLVEIFDTSADYLFGKSDIPHPHGIDYISKNKADFSHRLSLEMDANYLESELADKLNISISQIRKFLNSEEMPTPQLLEDLSQLLNKSTDYILGISEFSRPPICTNGHFPFHMDTESIARLQKTIGSNWNDFDADMLGLTYDEFYMMYYYGFIPHISVIQEICKHYNVSSDYLLNLSDSIISIKITRDCNEENLISSYRKLDQPYQQKVNGLLAEQILQQERDKYMRSSVAADVTSEKTGTDDSKK